MAAAGMAGNGLYGCLKRKYASSVTVLRHYPGRFPVCLIWLNHAGSLNVRGTLSVDLRRVPTPTGLGPGAGEAGSVHIISGHSRRGRALHPPFTDFPIAAYV